MDFPIQPIVTVALAAVTALITGWVAILKWGMATKEREWEARLTALKEGVALAQAENKLSQTRLEAMERRFIEINAEVRGLTKDHSSLKFVVDEIKEKMVTTQLYEQRMSSMEKSLNKLLDDINVLIRQRVQYPSGSMRNPTSRDPNER